MIYSCIFVLDFTVPSPPFPFVLPVSFSSLLSSRIPFLLVSILPSSLFTHHLPVIPVADSIRPGMSWRCYCQLMGSGKCPGQCLKRVQLKAALLNPVHSLLSFHLQTSLLKTRLMSCLWDSNLLLGFKLTIFCLAWNCVLEVLFALFCLHNKSWSLYSMFSSSHFSWVIINLQSISVQSPVRNGNPNYKH